MVGSSFVFLPSLLGGEGENQDFSFSKKMSNSQFGKRGR